VVLSHLRPVLEGHAAAKSEVVLGGVAAPGAIAVQFFFVLSGFVMLTAHRADFGKPWATLKFWWRRAGRIFPIYWIALLIVLGLLDKGLGWRQAAEQIFLQPVNVPDLVTPAWSLRFEISFYLMFGLCLLPYIGRFLLAAWFFFVWYCWCPVSVFKALHLPIPMPLYVFYIRHTWDFISPVSFFSPCSFYFFAGLLGAWLFARFSIGLVTACGLMLAGAIGLAKTLPLLQNGYSYGPPHAFVYAGLSFAGIILGVSVLERAGQLRFGVLSRRFGVMSYPLYILHMPLLLAFDRFFGGLKLGAGALFGLGLLLLAGIYGICGGFAFYIDQPLQHWLRRRTPPRKPIPT
jgi:exopolysaccharide production protein ExoZ